MITLAFALLDQKTGTYGTPFFTNHRAIAIRMVADIAADLNTTIGRHPGDFCLCQVGAFDDQTGELRNQMPEAIGLAVSFLNPPAQAPLFSNVKEPV